MKNTTHISTSIVSFLILSVIFLSCSSNGTTGSNNKAKNDTAGSNTTAHNRKKGKIFDKENLGGIKLTLAELNMVGKVKSVLYKKYEVSDKTGKLELKDTMYNVYTSFGSLLDQNEYMDRRKNVMKCTYKYDDKNKLIRTDDTVFYGDNKKSVLAFTYQYYQYDDKGNKIEEDDIMKTKDSFSTYKLTYKYDANGNEIEQDYHNPDGKHYLTTTYKYNEFGDQVEWMQKVPDGNKPQLVLTKQYDEKGYTISAASYTNGDTTGARSTYKNDEKGRHIEGNDYNKKGDLDKKELRKYDDSDNELEVMTIAYKPNEPADTVSNKVYEYEYDKTGNITKKTEYSLKSGKRTMTSVEQYWYVYY